MKQILLILLFISAKCFAQDTAISYSGIVEASGFTKEQLFINARSWYNETFKSSKDVLQINDKETGELTGKAILTAYINYKVLGKVRTYPTTNSFNIKILVKDGKYKYVIDNIENIAISDQTADGIGLITSSPSSPKKYPMISQKKADEMWQSVKAGIDDKIKSLIESLKKAIITTKDF